MFNDVYQSMRQGFHQSSFRRLFQYSALAKLFNQSAIPSPWVFFSAYLSSLPSSRSWFRSRIHGHLLDDFDNMLRSLRVLKKSHILTENNCNRVVAHSDPRYLDRTLSLLQQAGLSNQDSLTVVFAHPWPEDLAAALFYLKHAGMLNQDNFAVVVSCRWSDNLARALFVLKQAGILTKDNRARVAVANHASPDYLNWVLSFLQKAQILTQDNFALVVDYVRPYGLYFVLCLLSRAQLLNQDNFSALTALNHLALISNQALELIWDNIANHPLHSLTQNDFESLLTASEQANPMTELERVRDQILGIRAVAGHAASVHRSVSDSALRLMQSYEHDLNLDIKIQEIKSFVMGLSDSPKHQAAIRCIERMTQVTYSVTDSSGISALQLLALAYIAIHDESKRAGTLENAKTLLIHGLYEIQRGYNLNNIGQDLGGEDLPICAACTFNQLMEKLHGIHQDVLVNFITQERASSKFSRLAAAHANTYLLSLSSTANGYRRAQALVEQLKADGSLRLFWDAIKTAVQTALWDEFKEAYHNNPSDERFLALLDTGKYFVFHVSAVETALLASPGYQAYLEEQMHLGRVARGLVPRLALHGFWDDLDSSASARESFDRKYSQVLKS